MDIAPYGEFAAKAMSFLDNVLKRVLPAKMDEAEAAQLQTTVTLEFMKQDWGAIEKEYQDRADARALAKADADKGNWFTSVLSATVRPFFAYLAMAAFFSSLASQVVPAIPTIILTEIHKEIILTIIYFYFGGRTVEKGLVTWANMKAGK